MQLFSRSPLVISLLLLTHFLSPQVANASDSNPKVGGGKARLNMRASSTVRYVPYNLADGSTLTLISAARWSGVAATVKDVLLKTHQEYQAKLGNLPPITASVRLMDEADFFRETGAPSWTNAMYYKGEIVIPLSPEEPVDYENVGRSVKHEYTHAVINTLSKGRCPGWFDEGVSQLAEGSINPLIEPALKRWLDKNPPVSLGLLQGGFTGLETRMVPAAYAQSLYAAKAMVGAYGWKPIRNYLAMLKEGVSKDFAFKSAFQSSEAEFEAKLHTGLLEWSEHHNH